MILLDAYLNLLKAQREAYGEPKFLIMPMRDFEAISMWTWKEECRAHEKPTGFKFITHLNGVPVWAIRAPGDGISRD